VLYEQAQFEPLIEEPWDPAAVQGAIAGIVRDADGAFDPGALWPVHDWDEETKNLYVGAAGVIWALDALRRSGHAETALDLAAAALRVLELWRAEPEWYVQFLSGETHAHPAALLCGETGPLLVAFRLTADAALADELHALALSNVTNLTDDVMWGIPGTLLAMVAMHEWTGESRWAVAARESASVLRDRRGEDGLWRQDDDYRGLGTLHGAAGNTLALLRVEPDESLAAETAAVLAGHAAREDGLANWPGAPTREPGPLQWCTGAPGILAGAWDYLDEELVVAGAELVGQAGARGDEKGHGLCHGTSGNGFALLKAFARTGDELWLGRARNFAVHALAQAARIAEANGRRRYSLFTGDVGTALFAAACLDLDARFPIVETI
jgi:lanthionine synthetase-like protein